MAASTPLSISCPANANVELPACSSEDDIAAAYAIWASGFAVSDGCNAQSNIQDIPALPDFACGGGVDLSFTLSAIDDCNATPLTCSASFKVAVSTPLSVSCPAPVMLPADATEQEISDAYDTWKAGFIVSGGCADATSNIGQLPDLPPFDCGSAVSLNFMLSAMDACDTESCSSTFMVEGATPLTVDCPTNVLLDSCATQQEIQDAYDDWVAGFVVSNGINPTSNIGDIPELPAYECGEPIALSFTFQVEDACSNSSCSSMFVVKDAFDLVAECPTDPELAACASQDEIEAAYNAWAAGFVVSGGCADAQSNIQEIPALPDFECGAAINLSFTLEAFDACDQTSCSSTFTVEGADPLMVSCPTDVSINSPVSQQTISDAYNAWKAGFEVSGGCDDASSNIGDIPELPDYVCGEAIDLEFTLTAYDSCNPNGTSCTSSFYIEGTDPVDAGINGDLLICVDATVTAQDLFDALNGDPEEGGTWSPTPAGAGIYIYTVEGDDPCPDAMAQVTVTEQIIEIVAADPVCNEEDNFGTYSVDVTTNGGTLMSSSGDVIDNGGNSYSIIDIPNDLDITVTVMTDIGCEDSITIEAPDCVCIELDYDYTNITCYGEEDATIIINYVTPGATVTVNGEPYDENMTYSEGTYTIMAFFEGNDNPDCILSYDVVFDEPEIVDIVVTSTDITCNGAEDGTITVVSLSEGATYIIQLNGVGPDLSGQEFFGPGLYIITATVDQNRSENPCVDVDTVTIIEPGGVDCGFRPYFEDKPLCPGHPLAIKKNHILAKYEATGYTLEWSLNDDAIANGWTIDTELDNYEMGFTPGAGDAVFTVTFTNGNGCNRAFSYPVAGDVCNDPLLGNDFSDLIVYPNPVQDKLTVDFRKVIESDTKIEVFDLVGNRMYTNNLKKNQVSSIQIDFSNFPSNLYYMKITNGKNTIMKKVVLDK